MGNAAIKLAVVFSACFACAIGYAQSPGAERKWADSFARYKSTMRSLSPAAAKACESQLHRILGSIDQSQTCSGDSECTLVGEEPFGPTVPVRTASGKALAADMKQFRQSCYNESRHVGYNSDLGHMPACVKNRCMVKTSVKR
jgi:hypothetical protein